MPDLTDEEVDALIRDHPRYQRAPKWRIRRLVKLEEIRKRQVAARANRELPANPAL